MGLFLALVSSVRFTRKFCRILCIHLIAHLKSQNTVISLSPSLILLRSSHNDHNRTMVLTYSSFFIPCSRRGPGLLYLQSRGKGKKDRPIVLYVCPFSVAISFLIFF